MNTSGDAAESIVRMSLQGLEVAVRLSGSGAKNVAALMIAILKDQKQTKGKTRLTNMLKSGKELKVFSVRQEDFKKFTEEAKRDVYAKFNKSLVTDGCLFVGNTEQIIGYKELGYSYQHLFFYRKTN